MKTPAEAARKEYFSYPISPLERDSEDFAEVFEKVAQVAIDAYLANAASELPTIKDVLNAFTVGPDSHWDERVYALFAERFAKLKAERDGFLKQFTDELSANAGTHALMESLEAERDKWKANHDNQVKLRQTLMDRADLGDRARRMEALIQERDFFIEKNTALCQQLVYSESITHPEGKPNFQQGGLLHEAQDVVTAAECEGYVQRIDDLLQQLKETQVIKNALSDRAEKIRCALVDRENEVKALRQQLATRGVLC